MSDDKTPNREALDKLIAEARARPPMTPAERQQQKISFTYGMMPETSKMTREQIEEREYKANGNLAAMEAEVLRLTALVEAADALEAKTTHEREMVCQDVGMQIEASNAVDAALAAYRALRNPAP